MLIVHLDRAYVVVHMYAAVVQSIAERFAAATSGLRGKTPPSIHQLLPFFL